MEILRLINDARSKEMTHGLYVSPTLESIAMARSQKMATETDPLSHLDKDGVIPDELFKLISQRFGEIIFANMQGNANNLAIETSTKDAKRVFDAWMNSPSHRQVILHGIFRFMGMAKSVDGPRTVITGIFSDKG